MFSITKTGIEGCYEIQPRIFDDLRGRFVKVFHHNEYTKLGLETSFAEEYYSTSHRGVIRGMHFQAPPSDHVKVVYCVHGEVQDVVLDLRLGSPTYGQATVITLSASQGNFIYIPKGLAHGFCSTSEIATMVYKVSVVYDSQADTGVLWNSFGHSWPIIDPVISNRDANFIPFSKFKTPFLYAK